MKTRRQDMTYAESIFQMEMEEQLTILTDGVVEARGKTCELFGFERTVSFTRNSAQAIADTAQAFGQDDDITVVTVVRGRLIAGFEDDHKSLHANSPDAILADIVFCSASSLKRNFWQLGALRAECGG